MRNLSIRYKFLLVIGTLVTISILAYLLLATMLFNEDKKAYVYEGGSTLAETIAAEAETGLISVIRTIQIAGMMIADQAADKAVAQSRIETLFSSDTNLIDLRVFKTKIDGSEPVEILYVKKLDRLKPTEITGDYLAKLLAGNPIQFPAVIQKKILLNSNSAPGGPPLLQVALAEDYSIPDTIYVLVANLRQDRRINLFARSRIYNSFLMDKNGNILVHADIARDGTPRNLSQSAVFQAVTGQKIRNGVREYVDENGKALIAAFATMELSDLVVVSEITVDKAYEASRNLMKRSAAFAVLILCFSLIVSITFTNRLTVSLRMLFQATARIAKGDFLIQTNISSKDEIGALADSFNLMTGEIQRLLIETAEKARIEKELETANIVQSNFFPVNHLKYGPYEIAAYFKSASECGGDWWGSIELDNELVILIGDATGHGVPAALITAAAHSCATAIKKFSTKIEKNILTPVNVMELLNASVYSAGRGKIKMTFFVAFINTKTGNVRYVNASHEMPIVARLAVGSSEKTASKAEIDSLSGKPDNCLGQEADSIYHEHTYKLRRSDCLVWFTDGLTEGRNLADDEYGDRRLSRLCAKISSKPPKEVLKDILTTTTDFYEGRPLEDDYTLVVMKVRS